MVLLSKKTYITLTAVLVAFSMHLSAAPSPCQKACLPCYTPMQVSLVAPAQTSPVHCDVHGIRANLIYGKNRDVSGIDIGIVNHVTRDMKGIELGIVNHVEGNMSGAQRGFYNGCRNMQGFQDGFINVCHEKGKGMQSGFIYNRAKYMNGLQVGGINHTKRMTGLQFGLINITRDLHGAQIGLINIQTSRRYLKVVPILNISKMPRRCFR